MTVADALETTRIHRVAGCTGGRTAEASGSPGPKAVTWRVYTAPSR
jgi:hypothetical protein